MREAAGMEDLQSIAPGLKLGNDGIWYGTDAPDAVSYPRGRNDAWFAVEEDSFWFKHRNDCIVAAALAHPPGTGGTIFDIGGGNGFVSRGLANAGFDVVLVEPGLEGARNAQRRGVETVVCATVESARFKPCSLPAAGLFDVVEHIGDDGSFLAFCRSLIRPGGYLYLTVPAHAFLWSEKDSSAGHFRRYTLNGICRKIESAGFEVKFSTYIFRFLPLPIMLFRALPYRMGISRERGPVPGAVRDHRGKGRLMVDILDFFLNPEIEHIRKGKSMRFGGSCLVVARNP
jgi:2-polyprenyl-3-methyl-5-hydroxy-6-metoxy-1,4-benzoquinol methylase